MDDRQLTYLHTGKPLWLPDQSCAHSLVRFEPTEPSNRRSYVQKARGPCTGVS